MTRVPSGPSRVATRILPDVIARFGFSAKSNYALARCATGRGMEIYIRRRFVSDSQGAEGREGGRWLQAASINESVLRC